MKAASIRAWAALVLALTATDAFAGGGDSRSTAIPLFLGVVAVTLAITAWAARRSRSLLEFYSAGAAIKGRQNGFAIAGDALSAGAFLGLTALVYSGGFDGLVYAIGYTVGFPFVVFIVAERLRALGKYTFSDVICSRLTSRHLRVFAGTASLTIVFFYLIAQMVGAGQLIRLLFGLDYVYAELIVGGLMICYVLVGGMVATTWVQFTKAILLLFTGTVLAFLVLRQFDFNFDSLLAAAISAKPNLNMLGPTAVARNPLSALSLALALMFGTAGLPHVLMRFFTVPDVRAARSSVVWAVSLIGYFYGLIFVLGFGAIAIVSVNPSFSSATGQLLSGTNMAAVHLAAALGGDAFLGIVSAVAFATILAVVAGLTLAGASAVSHDLYAEAYLGGQEPPPGREVRVSRAATLMIGGVAMLLGVAFEKQNVAYMVSLAFGIAASATFPLLILSIFWRGLTPLGAIAGGTAGLLLSLALTVLGPSIWVQTLGFSQSVFPFEPPTIVAMPLAFVLCFAVSSLQNYRLRSRTQSFRRLSIE